MHCTHWFAPEMDSLILRSNLPMAPQGVGAFSCCGARPGVVPKTNQDRALVCHPFGGDLHQILLAVFDGHGADGHDIAEYAAREFARLLGQHNLLHTDPSSAMKDVCQEIDAALGQEAYDPMQSNRAELSGTTAVICLCRQESSGRRMLYTCHVGDSRAVLGSRCDGQTQAKQLTQDHKPGLPAEKLRIQKAGGVVRPKRGSTVERVWKDRSLTTPGLIIDLRSGPRL